MIWKNKTHDQKVKKADVEEKKKKMQAIGLFRETVSGNSYTLLVCLLCVDVCLLRVRAE